MMPRFDKAPLIMGFDLSAAMALARAMGVSEIAVADLLPSIEMGMVKAMRNIEDG